MARLLVLLALLVSVLASAGCASMPDHGGVHPVARDNDGDDEHADQQVRVFGVPPQPGESPTGLVAGFLEAVTSDEADYATARRYLTPEASQRWNPAVGITVLDAFPQREQVPAATTGPPHAPAVVRVDVVGTRIATVDSRFAYQADDPQETGMRVSFLLRRGVDDQWRIDALPDGLLMSKADFHRIYRSVSTYWYATDTERATLVPDPVYLRSRVGLGTALVRQLLLGPTAWLSPVVRTAFPPGTRLLDKAVSVEDDGSVRVRLSDEARAANPDQCERMAAQLLYTMAQAGNVASVQLTVRHGPPLCSVSREAAARYDGAVSATTPTAYLLSRDARALSLAPGSTVPQPVAGPFGDGSLHFDQIAVSRDERRIAGVDESGQTLLVGTMGEAGPAQEWAHAAGPRSQQSGLSSPSWDGTGALWVLDRESSGTRVLVLDAASGNEGAVVHEVTLQGVDVSTVTAIRLSPDGTRAAMVLGGSTVRVGRVERSVNADGPTVTVAAPRPVLPSLVDVKSVSWNGAARLAVLGREQQGSLQPQIVDIDGGNVVSIAPVSGMMHLAAPDASDQPLLADTGEPQVYRQAQGNNWTQVKEGQKPVYPG